MTNRKHTFPAPSADMILELIHADPNVESEYLSFYKSYILNTPGSFKIQVLTFK